MRVELDSPCKVNFILNILGRRPDGFHELETVMHPVAVFDTLVCEAASSGIELTCGHPDLPTGPENLVYRAAGKFLAASKISSGVRIHLEKRIPMAAGLGGGSGNAAATLLALNRLFDSPLPAAAIEVLAAELGSDVPFFLHDNPVLATGRGEKVAPLAPFDALNGVWMILLHPGFGISTAWAYKSLARFPAALNGVVGRAQQLVGKLRSSFDAALGFFYNSLEAPALPKYPLLKIFQEFLRESGAGVTLMSGSGSTTFALVRGEAAAIELRDRFLAKFGDFCWIRLVPLGSSASS